MTRTRALLTLLIPLAATTLLFWLVLHQISGVWLDVALHPEVRAALERSMQDQRRLRDLDPENRDAYRERFEATRKLLNRIEVIRHNRAAMLRRFELALLSVFVLSAAAAALVVWRRSREAQERERRGFLARLAELQETSRRHAHEIKGPLTAARLELERLGELARAGEDVTAAQESVAEELDRLARFAREFSSVGLVARPLLRQESLGRLVDEFCATFAGAWPGVALESSPRDERVCADRDLLRQVLVNLCSNSAGAGAKTIRLAVARGAIEVRDDGGGIPDSLRARVFDPYVTTRKPGEGMGLGLAISRKIMLDHGGDLTLASTSPAGTTFRLTFGEAACN